MARTKVYTLSPKFIDQTSRAVRQVREDGGSIGTTPHDGEAIDCSNLWLEITNVAWMGATNGSEQEYSVQVYDCRYGGTAMYATPQIAWNSAGYGNTATMQYGRGVSPTSTTCGDYTGHVALPTQNAAGKPIRYKAITYEYRSDRSKWGFTFDSKPDPIVHS